MVNLMEAEHDLPDFPIEETCRCADAGQFLDINQ